MKIRYQLVLLLVLLALSIGGITLAVHQLTAWYIPVTCGLSVMVCVFLHIRLLRPLNFLAEALYSKSPQTIAAYLHQKNEFGRLSRAITGFLLQNEQLKHEIEVRRQSEANLQAAFHAKAQADVERGKAEQFLSHQQALFQLNNGAYESISALMKEAMAITAASLHCERVGIWFYGDNNQSLKTDFIYQLSSGTFLPGKKVWEQNIPIYFSQLWNEIMVDADDALTHPATSELIDYHLKPKGITSLLDVPIRSGNRMIGLVCIEHVGPARSWTFGEKVFAKSLADVIAIRFTGDELKTAEQELLRNQKRFEETQELAQIGTWEINFFNWEGVWSKEMYRIFNVDPADPRPLFESYKTHIPENDAAVFEAAVRTLVETGKTGTAECRVFAPDGSVKYVTAILEVLKSPRQGKTIGIRGTVQDITKQKQAALAKSEFLSCMSHEIRTPINGVIGIANLLKEEQLTERQAEYVRTLNFSAQHLSTVVSDILDFSKIESGHLTFERVSFNLDKNCRDVFNQFVPRAAEKNLSFNYHPAPLKDFSLYGDYVRLNQVLNNLLSNAIKFTQSGSVNFGYTIIGENLHKATIVFSVSDTGIGIAPEQQAQIFESFCQADESITRQYGGTGLGLTISKKLVELQGGSISVFSEQDKGTEFTVELTFDKHVYEAGDLRQIGNTQKSVRKNLRGMKILVAEDNQVNAMVLTSFLSKWSIESRVAKDGFEALELLGGENFDMVLMDIQMPNVDGIEATRRIRASADEQLQRLPVIAFTADASIDTHRELLRIGFDHCLTKPFNPETLFSFLKKTYSAS